MNIFRNLCLNEHYENTLFTKENTKNNDYFNFLILKHNSLFNFLSFGNSTYHIMSKMTFLQRNIRFFKNVDRSFPQKKTFF